MKKILLVHLPFCSPASPSYPITYLYSMLKDKLDVNVLDLNLEFHKKKFAKYGDYLKSFASDDKESLAEFSKVASEYSKVTSKVYAENNKKVVLGEKPEFFDEFVEKIKGYDVVAFSIVYSSQAFYAYALMKELKNIVKVVGGPAVCEKLISVADECFSSYEEFAKYLCVDGEFCDENVDKDVVLDCSVWDLDSYFVPKFVMPIKTSSTCCYKQCTFCSHFSNVKYCEYDLDSVRQSVISLRKNVGDSIGKYVFLIDDNIPVNRLLKIGEMFKELDVKWCCQLRPVADFSFDILARLKDCGLVMIMWGVESGSDRVLKLIRKGTNVNDVSNVLRDSHKAGIKNSVFIMFGFPEETKEEFMKTINFLENNSNNIDLILTSVFGLQKGTYVYDNYKEFGISEIVESKRTILPPKISYSITKGMSHDEVVKLKKKYDKIINKINKYPKEMNFFRECMICLF